MPLKPHTPDMSTTGFCALINDSGRRVEFYLRTVESKVYMIALSGQFGRPATRQKAQGPFVSLRLAEDAMKAISKAMIRTGYEQLINIRPHWQFQMLAEVKKLRQGRADTQTILYTGKEESTGQGDSYSD